MSSIGFLVVFAALVARRLRLSVYSWAADFVFFRGEVAYVLRHSLQCNKLYSSRLCGLV